MSNIKRCPECDSINLTYDPHLGEIICNDCGLVVEEKMVDTGVCSDFNAKIRQRTNNKCWRNFGHI